MASLTELSFTWLSFISAMISNIASAARGIVGKKSMKKPIGKNMNAPNLYAIMTILSSIATLPLCLLLESQSYKIVLTKIVNQGLGNILAKQIFLSAIFYYLYNEVAFLTLDNVSPVTHALGNTIKRVVIIITSVLVFKTKMSLQGVIGSSIAILGVLLYSLTSNHFKK
jgi:solute carrier family 35 protein E1